MEVRDMEEYNVNLFWTLCKTALYIYATTVIVNYGKTCARQKARKAI